SGSIQGTEEACHGSTESASSLFPHPCGAFGNDGTGDASRCGRAADAASLFLTTAVFLSAAIIRAAATSWLLQQPELSCELSTARGRRARVYAEQRHAAGPADDSAARRRRGSDHVHERRHAGAVDVSTAGRGRPRRQL